MTPQGIFTADALDALIQFVGVVFVAVIAALAATRRESKQAHTQRHFDFSDERLGLYSDFLRQVNSVWADWFEAAKHVDLGIFDSAYSKDARAGALELDSQMSILRISVPVKVVSACGQVNGMIQTMVADLEFKSGGQVHWRDFEAARDNMTDAMRADIDLIGAVSDRREYLKKVGK